MLNGDVLNISKINRADVRRKILESAADEFKIFNDIIALLANALRFYALKYFVGIFVQKEESRWKHVSILYIIGWAWTSAISLLFSSPAMNILSNITSLFLIFFHTA